MFLVENCFYWIGFHIVEYLLDQGYTVTGNDEIDTDGKEHLSMFIGRNENFTHMKQRLNESAYDIRLTPHETALTLHKDSASTIYLPLLFGEWMPMNQDGMYYRGDFIAFDSDEFVEKAVYIGDFLKIIDQCIAASNLPSAVNVKKKGEDINAEIKLENSVFIRNNRPINDRIKTVKNHYKKFSKLYESK
ncbi:hypothetical protein [Virgibacillus ihumii]|uniref:hypothetical protein n=1 Tax=Virgibacillus ihumii TaxID=2686091 RepID=UPI00157C8240|nr:hypothetical protein [Virgibacillus ihumii]